MLLREKVGDKVRFKLNVGKSDSSTGDRDVEGVATKLVTHKGKEIAWIEVSKGRFKGKYPRNVKRIQVVK